MKSLNVSRIATAAAGLALLGATVASAVSIDSAGLSSYKFFNGDSPNVKIVIGSEAAPSDGIAAANIAAMIGNLAYQERDITVLGSDGISCASSGSSGGAGGSSFSSGQCVANVETPGFNPATSYSMNAYVEDRVDSNSDYYRSIDYPFYGPSNFQNARVITADHTNVLSMPNNGLITNNRNLDITEEQKVYVGAYASYDSSSDVVMAKDARAIYEITFNDPLPACWDTTKNFANCGSTSNKLDRTHTYINILGDQWVVTGFTLSGSGQFTNLYLGKETAYQPFMSIGDTVTAANQLSVKLTDITTFGFGPENQPKATFEIYDESESLIGIAILMPGESYEENGITLYLYDAMAGVSGTSYAEVSLFSDKLEIGHNKVISGHGNWKAYLNGQTNLAVKNGESEALQSIMLFDDISTNSLRAGESINLITNSPGLEFKYIGLEDINKDSLTLNLEKPAQITVGPGVYLTANMVKISSAENDAFQFESGTVSDSYVYVVAEDTTMTTFKYGSSNGGTFTDGNTFQAPFVSVTVPVVAVDTSFVINYKNQNGIAKTMTATVLSGNTVGIGTPEAGDVISDITAASGTGTADYYGFYPSGSVLYYKSSDSTYPYHAALNGSVSYRYSSTESSTISLINKPNALYFAIPELTEDNSGNIATTTTNRYWEIIYDKTLDQFVNSLGSTTSDKIGYQSIVGTPVGTAPLQEGGYISYRGNQFNSISATSANLKYSEKISHAKFVLTTNNEYQGSNGTTGNTEAGIGGFLLNQDGYIVQITDVTGSCSGGSCGGTGSCEISGLSGLVPSETKGFVINPLDTSTNSMVILDTAATSSSQLIAVGGPLVNAVTNSVGFTMAANSESVVKVQGSTIIVAGWTAQDTTTASNELIRWLAQNRNQIQR